MRSNTKFSIILPPTELKLIEQLLKKVKAKSNVEVIRRGVKLLQESVDHEALRAAYAFASEQKRDQASDVDELHIDNLSRLK